MNHSGVSGVHRVCVIMPYHLNTLAGIEGEIWLQIQPPVTTRAVLTALESQFPMLRGTIRDHVNQERRPKVRFYACEQDITHQSPDITLPDAVVNGDKPFMIVGAVSGG